MVNFEKIDLAIKNVDLVTIPKNRHKSQILWQAGVWNSLNSAASFRDFFSKSQFAGEDILKSQLATKSRT